MMASAIRKLMDGLYMLCVGVAGTALVLISAVMPWAVYTRYVLNRAASWPEPMAVLLMIVLTFFGAAACYRAGQHMRMSFFGSLLPLPLQRVTALLVELLMALIALFMINWGAKMCIRDRPRRSSSGRPCKSSATHPVSYTHLDVYKRQG